MNETDCKAIDSENSRLPVPDLPERVMMDFHGKCNLRCPMCFVHGLEDEGIKEQVIGTMPFDNALQVLEELSDAHPVIHPELYGEPTVAPRFREYVKEIKTRGMGIAINTNGLTLTRDLAQLFIDQQLDSISFSIDATTPETLQKIRGVDKLDKIKRNIDMMLALRGEGIHPRIGVSFTVQADNEHELDEFIHYWTQRVDMVRVSGVISSARTIYKMDPPAERTPCKMLYQSMPIHFNGDALMCCLDGLAKHVMGNVFNEGVKNVWHGEGYSKMRHYHETGQWDKVPQCKSCTAWAGHFYEEHIEGDLLIRRSPQFVYYNRLDRLESWRTGILKGHNSEQGNVRQSNIRPGNTKTATRKIDLIAVQR